VRSRRRIYWPGLSWIVLLFALVRCAAGPPEERVVLQTRPDVSETVFYSAAAKPTRSVILFTGSAGVVSGGRSNFLLRDPDRFLGQGISVAIPEVPSDYPGGMSDRFRTYRRTG
jgi:hypothetical protein